MAKYPRTIYAIYPNDEDGRVSSVYVGSTCQLKVRIRQHCHETKGTQQVLHEKMRNNGYSFQVLKVIDDIKDNHFEYDWIDFFDKCSSLEVLNIYQTPTQNFENCMR